MRYQELTKAINQNQFAPVYLFSGPEQYIGDMMEKNLIKAAVPESLALLNINRFSDKETGIETILSACSQYPMMSPYRVVVLEDTVGLCDTGDADIIAAFENYLKDPAPTTILIIKASKPDKRKKIVKAMEKKATVVEYKKLTEPELEKWIAARLKKADKKTTQAVVSRFIADIKYLENEFVYMSNVDHELEKLFDYTGSRERIDMTDLDATLPVSIEDNIYKLIDNAMAGNMAEALTMLNHFYLEGEQPISIFALLISQLRTLLQIKILLNAKESQQAIATKIKRPLFVVKKLTATAGRFPGDRLSRVMQAAAELDLQMKTGVVEPDAGLEVFILKLGK